MTLSQNQLSIVSDLAGTTAKFKLTLNTHLHFAESMDQDTEFSPEILELFQKSESIDTMVERCFYVHVINEVLSSVDADAYRENPDHYNDHVKQTVSAMLKVYHARVNTLLKGNKEHSHG